MSHRAIGAHPSGGGREIGAFDLGGVQSWMDGHLTEDEWYTRRRSLYRTNNSRNQKRSTARKV